MQRIAIIHDSNDYGVGCRDIFLATLKELGVTPVEVESYQTNDKDFTAQLSHISGANADGIALFGTLPAAPAIMNQARDLGIEARFMGAAGLSNEAIMTLAPEASQHAIATAYFHDSLDAEAKAWTERYMKLYAGAAQAPRPSQAAPAYRAVKVVAPCLADGGADKDKLRACIKAWRGMLFGLPPVEAHFDDTNQLVVPVVVESVEGKQFALLPGANQ
jgi:branched-chain amino acid transport system substrate-binding protein